MDEKTKAQVSNFTKSYILASDKARILIPLDLL